MSQVQLPAVWYNNFGLPRCRQAAWLPATCDAQVADTVNGSPSPDTVQLWTPLGRIFSASNQHCPTGAPILVRSQPWGPSTLDSWMGSLSAEPPTHQHPPLDAAQDGKSTPAVVRPSKLPAVPGGAEPLSRKSSRRRSTGTVHSHRHDSEPSTTGCRFNFCNAVKAYPPPLPPLLSRQLSNGGGRREGTSKLKIILRLLPTSSNSPNCADSRYIAVDSRQRQVTIAEQYISGRRPSIAGKGPTLKTFTYDAAFGCDDSLTEICSSSLLEVTQSVLNGEDACVLSFGHTGPGAQNTFVGEDKSVQSLGVIPCAISWVYRLINEQKKRTGSRFSVRVSALELSGSDERLRDLLAIDGGEEVELQNMNEVRVSSVEKAAHYLDMALSSRIFASEEERRNSHFVYTLHIYQYHVNQDGTGGVAGGRSRLHLIDLGSGEKSTKQGRTSLTQPAIGNVLLTLLQGQKHVPSRESKLTRLLKETIGTSQCKFVTVLSSISADPERYLESMNVLQISSRLYRLKRTKKSPLAISGQQSSGGESSCDDRSRRFVRRSASDPDCTTSSSEQSCDTVIFLGAPGVPYKVDPTMAKNRGVSCSAEQTAVAKHYVSSSDLLLPQRPSELMVGGGRSHGRLEPPTAEQQQQQSRFVGKKKLVEEWIDGPKARPFAPKAMEVGSTRLTEQSKRERVKQWIATQEKERLLSQAHLYPYFSPDEVEPAASNFKHINSNDHSVAREDELPTVATVGMSIPYGQCALRLLLPPSCNVPEMRYLEDIAEVEEESLSEKLSRHSDRKFPAPAVASSADRKRKPTDIDQTKAYLDGVTKSVSAAFSDMDGRLRILSYEEVETPYDSVSVRSGSRGSYSNNEEEAMDESPLSDEDLERAMEASMSSVRSHEILQKLKAESKFFVNSNASYASACAYPKVDDNLSNPVSIYKSLSPTCQSHWECASLSRRTDPEGKERSFEEFTGCTETPVKLGTQSARGELLEQQPTDPPLLQANAVCPSPVTSMASTGLPTAALTNRSSSSHLPVLNTFGKSAIPTASPNVNGHRTAADFACSAQRAKTNNEVATKMAKSRVVRESKLPRCCATGGQTSKARKADAATEKAPLKKPEKTSTSNNKSPLGFLRQYRTGGLKQVNRGSVSPGRRTSSGYDSGPESGIGAAFQGRSYARIVSPYAKVTQPKPNPRSSSGLGSDNSSAVSSDPGSGTQRKGALHRTTGGRLSLGNAQRVNRNSAAHSSGYDSTGPGPKDREAVVKPSTCSLESPSETDVASPSQRSPKRRWLLSFMGKGSKSAPQSPGLRRRWWSQVQLLHAIRLKKIWIMAKVEEAKREQEMLKAELRKAKDRLCVPLGKWTYDLHVLDCMGFNDSSMLEALTQETKILEKRVNACKSHVQMITVFDSRPSQSS
uniref:Kinesin motor domain-containing protein n=1 Tax=Trichuris muris TaxID=70415 RepID=A0A5S6Q086_TRIMR